MKPGAQTPYVSVILPVYNSALYIGEAIESILAQSFKDLEILVYDDCSTDNTVAVIQKYQDPRIRLIRKEVNTGITGSLIMGVAAANGKYIVRMDGDDVSDLHRIERQVDFLEGHPEHGVVGSWVQTIPSKGEAHVWEYPLEHEDIQLHLLVNAPFAHPSVAIRREVLIKHNINYSVVHEPAEDYKLWTDILKVSKGANLPEVLLHYRLHESQTISTKRARVIERSNQVRKEVVQFFFEESMSGEEVLVHYFYFNEIPSKDAPSIEAFAAWRKKLTGWFSRKGEGRKGVELVDRYWLIHLRCLSVYKPSYLLYLADRAVLAELTFKEVIRFIGKSLIGYRIRQA